MSNLVIDRYLVIAARRIDPTLAGAAAQQALQSLRSTIESTTQALLSGNPGLRPEEAALEAIFALGDAGGITRLTQTSLTETRVVTDYLSLLRERLAGLDGATLEATLARAREEILARAAELQRVEGSYAQAILRAINIHSQAPEVTRLTALAESIRRTTFTQTTTSSGGSFTSLTNLGLPQGPPAIVLTPGWPMALPPGFQFLGLLPQTATPMVPTPGTQVPVTGSPASGAFGGLGNFRPQTTEVPVLGR